MDEKLTAAEQAFEEWWAEEQNASQHTKPVAKAAYIAADARATERTARRCVEIVREEPEYPIYDHARAIAKEFGLD